MSMATRPTDAPAWAPSWAARSSRRSSVRGGKKKLPMADPDGAAGHRAAIDPARPRRRGRLGAREVRDHGHHREPERRRWPADPQLPERLVRLRGCEEDRRRASTSTRSCAALQPAISSSRVDDTCYSCAVRCKRVVEAEWQDKAINPDSGGPEYETVAMFGSDCGIDDPYAIAYASQLCNDYGVDTISAGATMAFAIECFEKGLITANDTGGIELAWGDAEAMIAMLEATLKREGFGDILAEGSAAAAATIGKGSRGLRGHVEATGAPGPYAAGEAVARRDLRRESVRRRPSVERARRDVHARDDRGEPRQVSEADGRHRPHRSAARGRTQRGEGPLRPGHAIRVLGDGHGRRLPVRLRPRVGDARDGRPRRR